MGFRLVPLRLSECKTTLGRGETGSGDLEQGGPGSAASSSSLGPTRPAEVSAGEHGWAKYQRLKRAWPLQAEKDPETTEFRQC